ncbi:MAG TPA: DNA primase [Gemmatimonadota bacterium]|nr:DNA primase [Gemmatimonadota bacterium]
MAGIPDRIVDEVRERTDILEIVGEVVQLRKRGRNWVGLCPFHAEKTPSFNVTPDKGMYYCFGCQAGGNAITFVMVHERLAFPEAVRTLAERAGIDIPEALDEGPDPDAALHTANRLAAEFYHRNLLESPEAQAARDYLARRGIGDDVRDEFLLGWAPEAWESLTREAARHGIDPEDLARAGLAVRSERTGGLYDRFRGRLCFPIRSVGGKVVAISGRRLDDGEPKYLNSADTPIFSKGRTLFNLDLARGPIRREGAAIVVEGNFDVLALYRSGFRNVVAPLGTAFTPEQARILKRYTATAYLAYDGDPAGERAAFRAADVLLGAGCGVRIVRLPSGRDPDAWIAEAGAAAFARSLEEAADVIDAKIGIVRERVDLGDVMKKRRAIRRLLESVARVPDPVTRSLYVDRLAAGLQVPRETLLLPDRPRSGRVGEPGRSLEPVRPAGRGGPGPAPADAPRGIVPPEIQDERYVLLHAVQDPVWLDRARSVCRPEFFSVPGYGEFFALLAGDEAADAVERIRRSPDAGTQRVLAELEVWREEQGFPLSDESFHDSLERLLLKAVRRGLMPDLAPAGASLTDALRRRDVERAIRRGGFRPGAPLDGV